MTDLTIFFQSALLNLSFENPVTEVEMSSDKSIHPDVWLRLPLRPRGNPNERGNRSTSPEMAKQKGKPYDFPGVRYKNLLVN